MEEPKRPVGRPPKPTDPHEIMAKEVVAIVELSRTTRKFLLDQVNKLQLEAEGVTNIKQRMDIIRTAADLLGELTKTARAVITEVQKPAAQREAEEVFDVDSFVEDLKR